MGATAAHRVTEKVADRTYTRIWTWMTNKCRKKMNGGVGYISIEISKERRRPRKGGKAPGMREELGILVLERRVPSP